MKYSEYLKCARKHTYVLEQFNTTQSADPKVLLEMFYLSGYILEGVVVYLSYKLNDWDADRDVRNEDQDFSLRTKLGFKHGNGAMYAVAGHNFQGMKNLISHHPDCQKLPYVGSDGEIDQDISDLLDCWKPYVRYFTYDGFELSKDKITRLLLTCKQLVKLTMAI